MEKRPDLSGVVQKDGEEIGRLSLWRYKGNNPKAPQWKGTLQTKSGKYAVSLWEQGQPPEVIEL